MEMNGKIFDINKGLLDPALNRLIKPAELPNCRCIMRLIIDEDQMINKNDILTFDASTVRHVDNNGNLHVERSPVTRVQVAPYFGYEIPGWQERKLKPDKYYYGYRCAEELSKPETLNSLKGIPIQLNHHDDYPDAPAKSTRIGSTGDFVKFEEPFLFCSLHIQDQNAIDRINDNSMRELSLGYYYEPDFTPGTTDSGQKYDFVMRNIRANHLALVEAGRCGPQVAVYDSLSKINNNLGDNAMAESVAAQEEKEVNLAKRMRDDAQGIIDMHEENNEGGMQDKIETHDSREDVLAALVAAGLEDEKAQVLADKLLDLMSAHDDEPTDEPKQKPDDKPTMDADEDTKANDDADVPTEDEEPDEESGKATDSDEEKVVADGLKSCGLDDASAEEQKAFAEGVKYGESLIKNPDERKKIDKEHESEGMEKALGHDSALKIAKAVERNIMAKFIAAEETARSLGKVRASAYDSAAAIYLSALKREGVDVSRISASSARAAYRAFLAGRKSTSVLANDSLSTRKSAISTILNKVNRGY